MRRLARSLPPPQAQVGLGYRAWFLYMPAVMCAALARIIPPLTMLISSRARVQDGASGAFAPYNCEKPEKEATDRLGTKAHGCFVVLPLSQLLCSSQTVQHQCLAQLTSWLPCSGSTVGKPR